MRTAQSPMQILAPVSPFFNLKYPENLLWDEDAVVVGIK